MFEKPNQAVRGQDESGANSALLDSPASAPSRTRSWVGHAMPRDEKTLSAELERMGTRSFWPLVDRWMPRRTTKGLFQSTAPVFSGYPFLIANEDERQRAFQTFRIVSVIGVRSTATGRRLVESPTFDRVAGASHLPSSASRG